ncbi:sulfite oxidase, mitochondrial isoform X2 [Plodia interpunctella]|uniref:sulfite oxidase, mitochondrial isoform X2 n=1 Tax=Plodia interpunctella TaxID=58824 RepID=UPI002367A8EC|nr:sulfite oxidase, mitochondrial isoform X2 [Plodia interpunctella]
MSLRTLLFGSVKRNVFVVSAPVARHASSDNVTNNRGGKKIQAKHIAAVLFGSVLVGTAIKDQFPVQKLDKKSSIKEGTFVAGDKKPGLPVYRVEEVSKHDSKNSFWVTYRHGVYDVTKFVSSHPGGEQIYNAAGLSIEPFWNVYGMHKTKEVFELLETFRIGNLHDDDIVDHSDEELWVKEPFRDKRLIVKTAKPFNAEISPRHQVDHFDTPNELFYVRQHMPVPELDQTHKLRVDIEGAGSRQFSLRELDQFPRHSLRAALMCAGNRRSEMNQVKPVKGISWAGGAVSNAVWSGVPLRLVLQHCGVDLTDTRGKHVIFTGADMDATGVNFSTSIPLSHAVDPAARVLLATHMNGEPLPRDHGSPLRVIVPGAPAVRSVKWLESITIGEDESPSHWHQKDYRAFNPSKTWDTADFSTAPPVYSLPVTSAICDPQNGDTVEVVKGRIQLRGYAYSGGGAKILRVDITTDHGKTWLEATPVAVDDAPPREHYAWTLWTADVPVDKSQSEMEIWVKATDSNFNTQPERFEDIWNIRGILSNAYHRIKVKLKH